MSHKRDPASGSRGKTLDPLCKKGVNLECNGNDGKTSKITGMEHDLAGNEIAFPTPEELEDDSVQFGKNPLRHVDQRSDIPHSGQGQRVGHESFPGEGKGTRPPGIKAIGDSLDAWTPVDDIHGAIDQKDPKNFDLDGSPEDGEPGTDAAAPRTKPQTLALPQI
ncbi:hypothetical protein OS493_019559 [Desmophyllum pertusum]|uniref:Uncharacterized protein n=1 Tax=Desmophyllum pertusum TaxID=174260 RepID=A0A9W9ZRW6_9CNID|nr:hypothetical protein OS493_019559 [Desmophyllum pertusum]